VKQEKVVVTAALPYANGDIHIGHLLEYIQADIYAKFLKLVGKDCLYICASDQHGTPVEINAKKAGIPPQKFVEKYWKEHQADFKSFLIEFDNFYKTHSTENRELSEWFFSELKKKDYIYTKEIDAIYCEHCKRYLPDRFVKGTCPNCESSDQYGDVCEKCSTILKGIDLVDPYCSICTNSPVEKKSTHYFFKLSSFSSKLKKWINSTSSNIQPEVRNWLNEWLKKGLEDWCISRDGPYFGFEIPGSKGETGEQKYFYVWLDAPIGYLASLKNYCDSKGLNWKEYSPFLEHIIGKDIAYFHYLFWPAQFIALGLPLPKLTTHGFVTVNGNKMSKSRGTFFTAKEFLNLYPAEALRFFYASHLDRKVVDVDLNFSEFVAVNNNVLTGNIGNFCYRVLSFSAKNYGQIDVVRKELGLTKKVEKLIDGVGKNYGAQNFKEVVKCILKIADLGNAYFQQNEPWKDKGSEVTKEAVGYCVNLARNLAILLAPILPEFTKKIEKSLGENRLSWDDISFNWKGKVGKVELLVQKVEYVKKELLPLTFKVDQKIEKENIGVIIEFNDLKVQGRNMELERIKKDVLKNLDIAKLKSSLQMKAYFNLLEKRDKQDAPPAPINLYGQIKKSGRLPTLNTVADAYNVISVKYGVVMGVYDRAGIRGNLRLKIADGTEFFHCIGASRPEKIISGEYVYVDDENRVVTRLITKQAEYIKVTKDTTDAVMCIQGNIKISRDELLKIAVETAELVVRVNGGKYRLLN
jgi:methionyl-tRNA synthetase